VIPAGFVVGGVSVVYGLVIRHVIAVAAMTTRDVITPFVMPNTQKVITASVIEPCPTMVEMISGWTIPLTAIAVTKEQAATARMAAAAVLKMRDVWGGICHHLWEVTALS
jgi:hypothetical protein